MKLQFTKVPSVRRNRGRVRHPKCRSARNNHGPRGVWALSNQSPTTPPNICTRRHRHVRAHRYRCLGTIVPALWLATYPCLGTSSGDPSDRSNALAYARGPPSPYRDPPRSVHRVGLGNTDTPPAQPRHGNPRGPQRACPSTGAPPPSARVPGCPCSGASVPASQVPMTAQGGRNGRIKDSKKKKKNL